MDEQGKHGLKIFLQFWLLIALLAAFNIYNYVRNGGKMFLIVGVACVAAFVGWALFYALYVRKGER
jgi:hypothetical protein